MTTTTTVPVTVSTVSSTKSDTTTSSAKATESTTTTTVSQPVSSDSVTTTSGSESGTTTTVHTDYRFGFDNWGFDNANRHVGKQSEQTYKPFISPEDYEVLRANLSNVEMAKVDAMLAEKTTGAAYGMAVTSILQNYGLFAASDLVDGAKSLYSIDGDALNDKVRSVINYYQVLQLTKNISQASYSTSTRDSDNLSKLIADVDAQKPVLFSYTYTDKEGKVVSQTAVAYKVNPVVKGFTMADGVQKNFDHMILAYNPNSSQQTERYYIYVNEETWEWLIPMSSNDISDAVMNLSKYHNGKLTLVTSDPDLMNANGFFSGKNDALYNKDNFYATMIMNQTSGNMEINFDPNSPNTGNGHIRTVNNPYAKENTVTRVMHGSNSYYVDLKQAQALDLSMEYENCMLKANSEKIKKLIVRPTGEIECQNTSGAYTLSMIMDEGNHPTTWHTISVKGADSGSIKLTAAPDKKGWVLNASSLKGISVVANNNQHRARVSFSTDQNAVLIYQIDENRIGIATADQDGKYNNTIAQTPSGLLGDVNSDGFVDSADAQLTLNAYVEVMSMNPMPLTDEQKDLADVDLNGEVDVTDAQAILIYYTESLAGNNPTWEQIISG